MDKTEIGTIERKKNGKNNKKYQEYLDEKENELKTLLTKINFHILMEIINFTEQSIKIFVKCKEKKEKKIIIDFLYEEDEEIEENNKEILITEIHCKDKEFWKPLTKIRLEYMKRIFGYFKNDKFRKHFQIVRRFEFFFSQSLEKILVSPPDISKIIPSRKDIIELMLTSVCYDLSPFGLIFDPKKNITIKSILLWNVLLLSSSKNESFNKILERIKCEKINIGFNNINKEKIKLTTGLSNSKQLTINNSTNYLFNEKPKQFNFSESFLNLTYINFYQIDISNNHFDFMLLYCKKLKIFWIDFCSIDNIFDLLKFLKYSKVKKLTVHNSTYNEESQIQNILKENPNINEKYKNSTLEDISINSKYAPFLHLFNNLKKLRIFQNESINVVNLSKLNLEKICIKIPSQIYLENYLKNTSKKKLKRLYISFDSSIFKLEKIAEIKDYPKTLTRLRIIYDHLDISEKIRIGDIITQKFLDFFKSCKVREFIFFIHIEKWSEMSELQIENMVESLFNAFMKNQFMKLLHLRLPSHYHGNNRTYFFRKN